MALFLLSIIDRQLYYGRNYHSDHLIDMVQSNQADGGIMLRNQKYFNGLVQDFSIPSSWR